MIQEFSVHPKAQNKNANILMWSFFGVAAGAFIVSVFMEQYSWIAGMVILASLTTAILVYTKYVSIEFYYDIVDLGGGDWSFIVRQLVGRRNVTLCRISLADIVDVKQESAEERRAHKKSKDTALFVYMPTLMPKENYRMYVFDGFDKSELLLEGSAEFFEKLLEFSKESKLLSGDTEK